jgi:hypothetical protein
LIVVVNLGILVESQLKAHCGKLVEYNICDFGLINSGGGILTPTGVRKEADALMARASSI